MSEPVFTSPLGHRGDLDRQEGLGVSLAEVADRAMIDLRGGADDAAFMAAAASALGVPLPTVPRTSATSGDTTVLWMSTDQWLVVAPRPSGADLLARLREALGGTFSFACDVSDARAILRVTGEGVREVLMKGTSVDMTAAEIVPGWVRRILFGEVAALCHMRAGTPETFDVYAFRSNADHVWEWLLHTGRRGAGVRLFAPQDPPAV